MALERRHGASRRAAGHRPLYASLAENDPVEGREGNIGLWYDKYCNQWGRDPQKNGLSKWTLEAFKQGRESCNPKLDWIRTVTATKCGDGRLLKDTVLRLARLALSRKGALAVFVTAGPFVTGLGRAHPVENGFAWHHALGVPYLPGSSVKGLVRAWLECWLEQGGHEAKPDIDRLLGPRHGRHAVGSVIFLDALPIQPIQLGADVMTPHYGAYYQQGETPGDWLSPNPIPFLRVEAEQAFLFGIMPRNLFEQNVVADMKQAKTWLRDGLYWLGAGAKTAVGYGRFGYDNDRTQELRQAAIDATTREYQQADIEARLSGLPPLVAELEQVAMEQDWKVDKNAFDRSLESWLERLEADPETLTIERFAGLIRLHYPKLLENPDARRGKKGKPVFSDRQRSIAKRINGLLEKHHAGQ